MNNNAKGIEMFELLTQPDLYFDVRGSLFIPSISIDERGGLKLGLLSGTNFGFSSCDLNVIIRCSDVRRSTAIVVLLSNWIHSLFIHNCFI